MYKTLITAALFLTAPVFSHAQTPTEQTMNLDVVTLQSAHSFADTVAKIKTAVASKNLTLFAVIDHSGAAQKAGLKMPATQVLIFGSPVAGTPMMLAHPQVALELPFRVLVAQNGDKVTVQFHPSTSLAAYGLSAEEQQKLAALGNLVKASIGQ